MPRFFALNKTHITTPLAVTHAGAYALYMIEEYATGRMNESEFTESTLRLLALFGFSGLGLIMSYAVQKIKDRCCEHTLSLNASADLEEQELGLLENRPSTCGNKITSFVKSFHEGFAWVAGTAAVSYAFFPMMKVTEKREIELLSIISTIGTVAGLGKGIYDNV